LVEAQSPSKDARYKWNKEDLILIENKGLKVVGIEFENDKLIILFENCDIAEYNIENEVPITELNLRE